jgi:hypothetical protein
MLARGQPHRTRRRRHRAPWLAGAALAAAAIAGCGGSSPRATDSFVRPACSQRTVAAIAVESGVAARAIAQHSFTQPSGSKACHFSAGGSHGLSVTVAIDSAPQAHYRLDRQVVEYGQTIIWSHQGSAPYPQYLAHLAMEADWLPVPRELLATDGVRIVDVTVGHWPRSSPAGAERAMEKVVRLYMRRVPGG